MEEKFRINEIIKEKSDDIENYHIKNNSHVKFNEYIKIKEEITKYLEKCKVDKEIIQKVKDMLIQQEYAINNEIRFWEQIFFKEGIIFHKELYNEIEDTSENSYFI